MELSHDELTKRIIGSAIEVHKILGPGLLESAYQAALEYELKGQGLRIQAHQPISIRYKGIELDKGYEADIIVNDKVIVELKSVAEVSKVFYKQLQTYLRLTDKRVGLLINFNVNKLIEGVKRIVNNYNMTV